MPLMVLLWLKQLNLAWMKWPPCCKKIRTLAVQASNGTNTAEDRAALSKEAASLANEISRIAKQTSYGGKTILNGVQGDKSLVAQGNGTAGDAQNITLQVGANA